MKREWLRNSFIAIALFLMGNIAYAGGSNSNFSETLPPAAAANSIPVSNGYDYTMKTLPSCNTAGSALSWNNSSFSAGCVSDEFTLYTATQSVSDNAASSVSTLTITGITPSIPSAWFGVGKTLRLTAKGTYSTSSSAHNWTWGVAIGTVTVVANAAASPVLNQSSQYFSETAYLTTVSTGASGSMLGSLDVYSSSGTAPSVLVLTSSAPLTAASGINMTNAQTVFPNFTWSNTASSMTVTNLTIELMN